MKTADPELMRAINRFHVMDAIRRFGPVSRVEISQLTELSPTTWREGAEWTGSVVPHTARKIRNGATSRAGV